MSKYVSGVLDLGPSHIHKVSESCFVAALLSTNPAGNEQYATQRLV
jgi:hypothetical protein